MPSKLEIIFEANTTAFKSGLRKVSDDLKGFERNIAKMKAHTDRFAKRNAHIIDGLQSIGTASVVALGAVGLGVKSVVDEAVKFESAMASVKKVVDFESPQAFKDMQADILKLSQTLPMSADGLAEIMAAAGQSGIAQNELKRFAESAAKMGIAFDISASEAGEAMAQMRTAFKMSQDEVETLADKINYLGNSNTQSAPKIMAVVQRIGALGEIAGVSSDTIAAMAASLTAVEPDVAATGIKNMMLALTKGESATKEQMTAWKQLGISHSEVAKGMQTDSVGTIDKVMQAINKLPKDTQTSVINQLFGAEALPVVAQFAGNTELLAKNLAAVADSSKYAGSMLKEFESMAGTSQNQMALFSNNITAVKIALGTALLPAINSVMTSLTPLLQTMSEWAQKNPELTATITAVTAGVLAVGVALGALGLMIPAISTAISALGAVMAVATVAMNPPVLAIMALVTAGVLLYKNWDKIKAKASEIFASLPAPVQNAFAQIKSVYNELVGALSKAFEFIIPMWQANFAIAKGVISSAFEAIKAVVNFGLNAMKAVFSANFVALVSVVGTAWNLIKNAFSTAFAVIKALVHGDMQGVKNAISNGMNNAWQIVKTGVSNIVGAFKNLGGQLLQAGKDAIQGFINGVKAKMNEALATAKQMAAQVYNTVKSALDIRSPSRKMKKLGKHTAEGMAVGIKKGTPKVVKAAKKMAQKISDEVKNTIASLQKEIALFGDDSTFSAIKYDIEQGKYKGTAQKSLDQMLDLAKQKDAQKALGETQAKMRELQDAIDKIGKSERQILQAKYGDGVVKVFDDLTKMQGVQKAQDEIKNLQKELEKLDKTALENAISEFKAQGVPDDIVQSYKQASEAIDEKLKALEKLKQVEQENLDVQKRYADFMRTQAIDGKGALAVFDFDNAQGKFANLTDINLKALREMAYMQDAQKAKSAFMDLQSPNELQKLQQEYTQKIAIVDEYERLHTDKVEVALQARQELSAKFAQAQQDLQFAQYSNLLGEMGNFAKSALGEQAKSARAMFNMQKGVAIAQSAIAIQQAIAKAFAVGFPANIPLIAQAVAQGASIASNIRAIAMPVGQAHDGIMSVPKSGTWNLEKGERVLPQHTAKALDKKLDNVGGNVTVNVAVNMEQQSVQADNTHGRQIGEMIALAVKKVIIQEKRQGGLLYG